MSPCVLIHRMPQCSNLNGRRNEVYWSFYVSFQKIICFWDIEIFSSYVAFPGQCDEIFLSVYDQKIFFFKILSIISMKMHLHRLLGPVEHHLVQNKQMFVFLNVTHWHFIEQIFLYFISRCVLNYRLSPCSNQMFAARRPTVRLIWAVTKIICCQDTEIFS